jgi:hypothetical protein
MNSNYAKAMKYLPKCFSPSKLCRRSSFNALKIFYISVLNRKWLHFLLGRRHVKFLSVFSSPRDLSKTRPLLRTRKYFVRIQIRVVNYYRSVSYPGHSCDRLKKTCYQELRIRIQRIRIRKTDYSDYYMYLCRVAG